MSDDDFKVIVTVAVPKEVDQVRFYEETLDHIAEEHAEFKLQLPSYGTAIEDAVANPSSVHRSTWSQRTLVFCSDNSTYEGNPIRVIVKKLDEGTTGRVQTAYFSGNTYTGTLLWSAGDE